MKILNSLKGHFNVIHHIHLRKRVHQNLEPYPHPDKFKFYLDKLIFVIAIVGPLMAMPQLFEIWHYKSAAGVSVLSWLSWALMAIVWLVYGIVHKEKPIIIANALWVTFDFLIAIGAFIYG